MKQHNSSTNKRVRNILKKTRLTRKAFAKKIGVSHWTVDAWLKDPDSQSWRHVTSSTCKLVVMMHKSGQL